MWMWGQHWMNSCEVNIPSKSSKGSWGSRLPTFASAISSFVASHSWKLSSNFLVFPKAGGSAIVAGVSAVAMARSGVVFLSPPLASTSASCLRDCCSCASNAGIIIRDVSMFRSFAGKRVAVRPRSSDCQRWRPSRASVEQDSDASPVITSSNDKEDLSAKLAAAEAEAEALRKELAARKGNRELSDLSKLKPATPDKRIDGTGYRETIFSGPGNTTGTPEQQPSKWGLSEAELFLSKGAPTEGMGLGGKAMDPGSEATVTRRLTIGVGIAVLTVGLAFVKFPTGRPAKPLFLYLVSILQLQQILKSLEAAIDVETVKTQLEKAGSSEDIKNSLLSAAGWLDGPDAEKATSLAYEIFEYVDQADYKTYFENYGEPSPTQQMEFLKFSLQSITAARKKVDEFLALAPSEELDAAASQFAR